MIFLNVKIDGMYGFHDFEINLTFPRRVYKSIIGRENLPERPRFRYKKVVVLSGAGATGKTALGEALHDFCVLLATGDASGLLNATSENGYFEIDFLSEGNILRRVSGSIKDGELTAAYQDMVITMKDCYETAVRRLRDPIPLDQALPTIGTIEFYTGEEQHDPEEMEKYVSLFVRTLDPSIEEVKYQDGKVIAIRGGKEIKHVSAGTLQAISCAHMTTSILQHKGGFFYADAMCSNMKSETELGIFGLFASAMKRGEQLIYTTYNTDILTIVLPKHSYMFLRREFDEDTGVWKNSAVSASDFLTRTTDSVYWAERSDVFGSQADDYLLNEIDIPWTEVEEGDLILGEE